MEIKYFNEIVIKTKQMIEVLEKTTDKLKEQKESLRKVTSTMPENETFSEEQDEEMFKLMQQMEKAMNNLMKVKIIYWE